MNMGTSEFRDMPLATSCDSLRSFGVIASSPKPIIVLLELLREASRRSEELTNDPSLAIDDDELWRRVDG